jgi:hypothetical protein
MTFSAFGPQNESILVPHALSSLPLLALSVTIYRLHKTAIAASGNLPTSKENDVPFSS